MNANRFFCLVALVFCWSSTASQAQVRERSYITVGLTPAIYDVGEQITGVARALNPSGFAQAGTVIVVTSGTNTVNTTHDQTFTLPTTGLGAGPHTVTATANAFDNGTAQATLVEDGLALSSTHAGIPRDTISTTQITTKLMANGTPLNDKTVTFTIAGPGTLSATTSQTDVNGNAGVTLKSSDIAATNATVTISATAEGEAATKEVVMRGLVIDLTTAGDRTKIYKGVTGLDLDKLRLIATVKDTANNPAIGSIKFETAAGSFTEGEVREVQSNGTIWNILTFGQSPSDTYQVKAILQGTTLSDSVNIVFAAPRGFFADVKQRRVVGGQSEVSAFVTDQEGLPFPGAQILFVWQVPDRAPENRGPLQSPTFISTTANQASFLVQNFGPEPTDDGRGNVQFKGGGPTDTPTALPIVSPQFPLTFRDPITFGLNYSNNEVEELKGQLTAFGWLNIEGGIKKDAAGNQSDFINFGVKWSF